MYCNFYFCQRKLTFLIILMWFAAAFYADGAVQFISNKDLKKIETAFDQGKTPELKDIVDKFWICNLYGIRSRFQVEKELKLYQFKLTAENTLSNSGAQIISDYQLDRGDLIGVKDQFKETLRIDDRNRLVSKLVSTKPQTSDKKNQRVITYAICE